MLRIPLGSFLEIHSGVAHLRSQKNADERIASIAPKPVTSPIPDLYWWYPLLIQIGGSADKATAQLNERERQQARTKQHETRCRYRQESARHQVMVSHDAPASLDARPNSWKTSERALLERGDACRACDSLRRRGQGKCWRSPGP